MKIQYFFKYETISSSFGHSDPDPSSVKTYLRHGTNQSPLGEPHRLNSVRYSTLVLRRSLGHFDLSIDNFTHADLF